MTPIFGHKERIAILIAKDEISRATVEATCCLHATIGRIKLMEGGKP